MKSRSQALSLTWVVLFVAVTFLLFVYAARIQRVEFVSASGSSMAVADAKSPTGYAGGMRRLVVPEQNYESYAWIMQTQQMFARGEWRVRHADYDNAPTGRDVHAASPYRWWLGSVAWVHHAVTGTPVGRSVESAALFAGPILHLLLLVGVTVFAARRLGGVGALVLCAGIATLFPLATAFLPGQPDDHGLVLGSLLWCLLFLVVGVRSSGGGPPPAAGVPAVAADPTRRYFILSGVAGGFGLWLSVQTMVPIIGGLGLGGILAGWVRRRTPGADAEEAGSLPWRAWAVAGAATSGAGYLIEYFPRNLDVMALRLEAIHPLYSLAWLGLGELMTAGGRLMSRTGAKPKGRTRMAILALAALAVAAIPLATALHPTLGFLAPIGIVSRASMLPEAPGAAENFFAWLARDRFGMIPLATILPLTLLGIAGWQAFRRDADGRQRALIALCLGPAMVALAFALARLQWWASVDAVILVVTALLLGDRLGRIARIAWPAALTAVALAGVVCLVPRGGSSREVTQPEIEALIERELAHWLSKRQAPEQPGLVLAPPSMTAGLIYYGGLRGLGTPYWENKDGITATIRIAGATSADEGRALAQRRGLTHIVIPSWNTALDEYAPMGGAKLEQTLLATLHAWLAPRWLRPVPYLLPAIRGLEAERVVIFELVDVQDNALALSRLAEYFLDMEQLELAAGVGRALHTDFGTDFGGLIAQARIAAARRDGEGFGRIVEQLVSGLAQGFDEYLLWDQRISLAVTLVEARRYDLARQQAERCLEEANEDLVRSLPAAALYRFLLLLKRMDLEIEDPELQRLARELLPAEMRERV